MSVYFSEYHSVILRTWPQALRVGPCMHQPVACSYARWFNFRFSIFIQRAHSSCLQPLPLSSRKGACCVPPSQSLPWSFHSPPVVGLTGTAHIYGHRSLFLFPPLTAGINLISHVPQSLSPLPPSYNPLVIPVYIPYIFHKAPM